MGRVAKREREEREAIEKQNRRQQEQKAQQEEAQKTLAVNLVMAEASREEDARVRSIIGATSPPTSTTRSGTSDLSQ